MQERTRKLLLLTAGILVVGLLAVWWYSGFSLEFMRFFAAEPTLDGGPVRQSPPPGCYYQEVQCIQAPCPPVLVCPSPSCQPRPACLDAVPSCDIAEPADGWCPPTDRNIVRCAPATQTVRVGVQASLTATGGAGLYVWYAPEGNPPNTVDVAFRLTGGGENLRVAYDKPGTKKVTASSYRVPNDPANPVQDFVACTVVVTP